MALQNPQPMSSAFRKRRLSTTQVTMLATCVRLEGELGRFPTRPEIRLELGWGPGRTENVETMLFDLERHGFLECETTPGGRFLSATFTGRGLALAQAAKL